MYLAPLGETAVKFLSKDLYGYWEACLELLLWLTMAFGYVLGERYSRPEHLCMDDALAFPDFALSWLPGPLLALAFTLLMETALPQPWMLNTGGP